MYNATHLGQNDFSAPFLIAIAFLAWIWIQTAIECGLSLKYDAPARNLFFAKFRKSFRTPNWSDERICRITVLSIWFIPLIAALYVWIELQTTKQPQH